MNESVPPFPSNVFIQSGTSSSPPPLLLLFLLLSLDLPHMSRMSRISLGVDESELREYIGGADDGGIRVK